MQQFTSGWTVWKFTIPRSLQTKIISSIRNPKSKTVLIFYSQKTINTISKISIYFDTSRILFKSGNDNELQVFYYFKI